MEETYLVAVKVGKNYNGRDRDGKLRFAIHFGGIQMTKACAEQLADKLRAEYPQVQIQEAIWDNRDELIATSLADLGEEKILSHCCPN
jgi:hypothetical protein